MADTGKTEVLDYTGLQTFFTSLTNYIKVNNEPLSAVNGNFTIDISKIKGLASDGSVTVTALPTGKGINDFSTGLGLFTGLTNLPDSSSSSSSWLVVSGGDAGSSCLQLAFNIDGTTSKVRSHSGNAWSSWEDLTPPSVKVGLMTLSSSWTSAGTDLYSQSISLSSSTVITANSKVDLQPNNTIVKELRNAGVTGMYIANDAGSLSAYVMGAAPTTALENIQYSVTEVLG